MPISIPISPEKIRERFDQIPFEETNAIANPVSQMENWIQDAEATGLFIFPQTFSLSTVNSLSQPSSRIVIMKDLSAEGLSFFTHLGSSKAQDLEANPFVACNFYWPILERQIKILGIAKKVGHETSDAWFANRPRQSQISAWASSQSERIQNAQELESKFEKFEKLFKGREIPRPSLWGGYLIVPNRFEFWQLRQNHFHDCLRYEKDGKESWHIQRISP